jgi:hypothetical protein
MPKRLPVQATRTDGTIVGQWLTATEASKAVGCSASSIAFALRVQGYTAAGYLWSRWDAPPPESFRCSRCRVDLPSGAFRWFASPISGQPVRRCYCRECESRKTTERLRRRNAKQAT